MRCRSSSRLVSSHLVHHRVSCQPDSIQQHKLSLTASHGASPAKLRSTLTYQIGKPGHVTLRKLDFHLHLSATAFVAAVPCSPSGFSALLGGGEMGPPQSVGKISTKRTFHEVVDVLCKSLHVGVVEFTENAASLYGLGLDSKHVCLLVKISSVGPCALAPARLTASQHAHVTVDGKSNDAAFLGHVLAELKTALAE